MKSPFYFQPNTSCPHGYLVTSCTWKLSWGSSAAWITDGLWFVLLEDDSCCVTWEGFNCVQTARIRAIANAITVPVKWESFWKQRSPIELFIHFMFTFPADSFSVCLVSFLVNQLPGNERADKEHEHTPADFSPDAIGGLILVRSPMNNDSLWRTPRDQVLPGYSMF